MHNESHFAVAEVKVNILQTVYSYVSTKLAIKAVNEAVKAVVSDSPHPQGLLGIESVS